jgi:hypothetical protein
MSYYVLVPNSPSAIRVFQIEDTERGFAVPIGVTNAPRLEAEPGETIWETLRRAGLERGEFHKAALGPGEFYPRMWRPSLPGLAVPGLSPEWNPSAQYETGIANIIAIARGQLTTLVRQLERICQTVQPEGKNLDVYGHDIRNLLILACTEAEAHWRGVLVANGVPQKRSNTKDYVKLREPMKLKDYAVVFPNYPWLSDFKPFEEWNAADPTRSLKWYDAYHAVKHDRETKFEEATLRRVFEAVSACAIMMVSQFGFEEGLGQGAELQSFFYFSNIPKWQFWEAYSPLLGKQPTKVDFGFQMPPK